MNKLMVTFVASAFVFTAAAGFAAETAKKEELTKEQRSEMRNRADKLTQERAQAPTTVKADVTPATKAKTDGADKSKKVTPPQGVKAQPKA